MKVSSKKLVMYGLAFVAVLVLFSLCTASKCEAAGELVHAGPAQGFANSVNAAKTLSTSSRANQLPDAYLYFSKQLELFYVQMYDGSGALSGVPIPVPAGSSLILPAPEALASGSNFIHKIWLNATTVTDSVFIIPMSR